jgi:hypothetical protein
MAELPGSVGGAPPENALPIPGTVIGGYTSCSLAAGFLTVLNDLRARPPAPEQIVVEASGVALRHKIRSPSTGDCPGSDSVGSSCS